MTSLEVDYRRFITVLFWLLVGTEIFLVLADACINVQGLILLDPVRGYFNITREDGIASWFAVTQTWMLGLTAGVLYFVARAEQAARWRRIGWSVIAVFLLCMAVDDGTEFHERIGSIVEDRFEGDGRSLQDQFFPSYTWQLVFLPIFGAFGMFVLWFLNRELKSARLKIITVAAIGLLVMAVVADFFEGLETRHPLNLHAWVASTWDVNIYLVRHYSKSLEEFMEMLAMTMLWIVFLSHLARIAPEMRLRFRNPPG